MTMFRISGKLDNGQVLTGTITSGADFDKVIAGLPAGVKLTRVSLKPLDSAGVTIRAPRAKKPADSKARKR